ncbi:MAG: TolC family protein [Prevotellaceae bacterium]|jgi:outer membrane protein TolC|nr:TolC family protein [Prevotellaceae bacterium]
MRKLFSTIAILSVCASPLKSESYHLSLDESIEVAKAKSYRMKRLQQDLKIAEYNLKSATSRFKTHIDLRFTLPQYTETVRQWEDSTGISFYPIKQLNYSGGLTINQPLPTDGNIFIETGLSGLDDFYASLRSGNLSTRIGFTQPIHSFYGYNAIKSSLKSAELAYEQSSKALKREELNLVYDVSNAYYQLLSLQKSAEIAAMDLERQTEAFEISKNKYEAGLIKEVDALQMEVDLAEAQSNYDMAILSQTSSTASFKEMLGVNLSDTITLSSELRYKTVSVDPEMAVQLALENRLEIREQDIQIELQGLNIKRQRSEGMVKGNINAYFEKIGVSLQNMETTLPSSLKNVSGNFVERPANFGVGFSLSIPLLDWGENRALVRAAEARMKQSTLRKEEVQREIETEVRNLVAGITSNLKRLQLLEKNVLVAEKSFEITRQRFSDGDIDSQSLALERNRLNTAYTSHLRAYITYQLSLADLMRKTFHDFMGE